MNTEYSFANKTVVPFAFSLAIPLFYQMFTHLVYDEKGKDTIIFLTIIAIVLTVMHYIKIKKNIKKNVEELENKKHMV
jgi:hypothetical protein